MVKNKKLYKIVCSITCLMLLFCILPVSAFAANPNASNDSLNLNAFYYTDIGKQTERSFNFAYVNVVGGVHTLDYDNLYDTSGNIIYRNNIAFDSDTYLSAEYAFLIGLINSCTTSSHAIINVEQEIYNLNYFLESKWADSTNNYEYRSYIDAVRLLGLFCVYSYDWSGYNTLTDDPRDPDTRIEFSPWFNSMNQKFIEEWFSFYNDIYSETNGVASHYYSYKADTLYKFKSGTATWKTSNPSKALYYAENLHIEGGTYVGVASSPSDFVLDFLNSLNVAQWASWMPAQFQGVLVSFYVTLISLLVILITLKFVRG